MSINEAKIHTAIKSCINKGNMQFAIFPFGKNGKLVKRILNDFYAIREIIIIDNQLAREDSSIISINEINQIDDKFTILFSTDREDIRANLLSQAYAVQKANVIDIMCIETHEEMFFSPFSEIMDIDKCSNKQLAVILERTKRVWENLGNSEPYWSVLTSNEYKLSKIDEDKINKFYNSGYLECLAIIKTLKRINYIKNENEIKKLKVTEIGCGTGRVTKSLAQYFEEVYAYDISLPNLSIAKQKVQYKNVFFDVIREISDYKKLPRVDLVYSKIVLQHNCPPVIDYILNCMLQSLANGGVCIFQVPTYKNGYKFKINEYIECNNEKMEMHLLPQQRIFEIINSTGCIPLEVYQDNMTGNSDFSTTFVVTKLN